MIKAGAVAVDGSVVVKVGRKVRSGSTVAVVVEGGGAASEAMSAAAIVAEADAAERIDVIYEDEAVVVLYKPADMVVHPAPDSNAHFSGTLVNALLALYGADGLAPGPPDGTRPGIVHRIDRHTSGLLVVARTQPVLDALQGRLAVHDVERVYTCLVQGLVRDDEGTVDAPLGRHPKKGTLRGVVVRGRKLWALCKSECP